MQHVPKIQQRQQKTRRNRKKILNHANEANLHKIVQHSSKTQTKIIFKQFMKEKLHIISAKPAADKETHEKIQPKLIARLANTLNLTCKAHSGLKHHDIDQPLPKTRRLELLNKSSTTCQCQTREDQPTQTDNNYEAPTYCQQCNRAIAIKNHTISSTPSCMTCRITTRASRPPDTKVCRNCQVKWLLNPTQPRKDTRHH